MTLLFFWKLAAIMLALGYAGLMAAYFLGWKKLPVFEPGPGLNEGVALSHPLIVQTGPKLSIIIAARNEELSILNCINSILNNDYPKHLFEIIVIDDFSEDMTVELIELQHFTNVRVIKLSDFIDDRNAINSFKKKAIEIGINHSIGELIITTDADCIVPKNWLFLLTSFYERNRSRMIAAPVNFYQENTLLERFQSLDFAGMMGITGAGIAGGWQHMANGANLLFERKTFEEIGGYGGIDGPASGDDMLLMQKIGQRWPGSVLFLKNRDATVLTKAKPDWAGFFSQRLRWGTKSSVYPEKLVTATLGLVWLFCVNLILSTIFWLAFGRNWGWFILFQFALKMLADFFFLRQMTGFFNRRDLMRWFLPSFFIHIFYIVAVGTASIFVKKYEWKGRRVS